MIPDDQHKTKVPLGESFLKSQITSVTSTAVDFTVLVLCTELIGIYYVISKAIAACCGAIVSFTLGRKWAFRRSDKRMGPQALKYIFTSLCSLGLNVYGIYFFTDCLGFHYILSNVIIAVIVAVGFNFFMYRYFVFK